MDNKVMVASGKTSKFVCVRHGEIPVVLFGAMVRVIAYETRR